MSSARGRWRKRKREPQISRRQKGEDDDDEEENDAVLQEDNNDAEPDEDYDLHSNHHHLVQNPNSVLNPLARENEVLSDAGTRLCDFPAVIRHVVNRPHSSVLGIASTERVALCGESRNSQNTILLENISYGQLQALSTVPSDCSVLGSGDQEAGLSSSASHVITPPSIVEGSGVVKRFGHVVHVVPMHSDWFSLNTVHRLERQVVPHFFSRKSSDLTPEKYTECRNLIVARYMENPNKRLMLSDCKDLAVGIPTDDVARIFRFLDHWGVVNYCAASPAKQVPWNAGSYLKEDVSGEVHVPSVALKSIDSLIQFDKPKCRLEPTDVHSASLCKGNDISDLDSRIRERLSENHCNYCSCSISSVYYQSQKEVDTVLCMDCFYEGRFVVGHSSIDFIKVDATRDCGDVDGESWTDQETLLLLEAVEIYNENWNDIADHVGTKSKAQCILHFIRLPMGDGPLENFEVPNMSTSALLNAENDGRLHSNSNGEAGNYSFEPNPESRLLFANSGNPVMAMVAFLASAIGPRVAAACAHASLGVLSEDSSSSASGTTTQLDGSRQRNRMNSEGIQSRERGSHEDIFDSEEISAAQRSWGANEAVAPIPAEKVEAAIRAGLAAAATKAKMFADHEEREIQRLSANIINHQLKRLELRLKQFAEIETLLMKECEQVERTRQRLAAERGRAISSRLLSPPSNIAPPINRQQTISASPSHQIQVHPHMSFMPPRQPMLSFGSRLPPDTAINPSSSAMFHAQGNAQPSLGHSMLRPLSGTTSGLG